MRVGWTRSNGVLKLQNTKYETLVKQSAIIGDRAWIVLYKGQKIARFENNVVAAMVFAEYIEKEET